MTNDDMIKIALAIIVGIVSAFSKSLFDRILAEYKPDIKKIKSRIFFLVLILFRFIIPFIVLIILYIKTEKIDKIFVVSFSTISFIFIFNIFYDIIVSIIDKRHKENEEDMRNTLNYIFKLTTIQESNKEDISKIFELLKKHIGVTDKIIDKFRNG